MAKRRRIRPRTFIIAGIVLLLLAGLFAGLNWVYERGLKREGLYERARRAAAEGRYDDALTLARETLVSEPSREAARELILDVLMAAQRPEEADAEARRYLGEDPERSYAAVRLCQLALKRGDMAEAERLAHTFVDRDPVYAYHVLSAVRDLGALLRHDVQQRLEAAALMRSFASMAESDSVRADAIIYSAEVSHEIAPDLPQAELIAQRVDVDLKEAATAVNLAVQANKNYTYEIAMGRIRILSSDPEEAALGAKMLRPHSSGTLKRDIAVFALARYHAERGEWKEAADLARDLTDPYLWQRLCWVVCRSQQPDAAAVLEAGPFADTADARILHAALLARSDEAERRGEALRSLTAMVEDPASEPAVIVPALIQIASSAGAEAALAAAEHGRVEERNDPRITALVAALMGVGGSERGLELAERLARETDEPAASRDLMGLLGSTDRGTFDRYLDTQVGKGGESENRYRLQRAFTMLARARAAKGDRAGAEELRVRVRSDLEALRSSDQAKKVELVTGFQLAVSIGEAELAGALISRALALPGVPATLDVRLLAFARSVQDKEALGRLAAGMRAAAEGLDARAYVEVLAEIVSTTERVDGKAVVAKLESASKDVGSRQPSLELACRIALNEDDPATAERLAKAALAGDPRSPAGLEVVGATMLSRGAPGDVVAFYAALPVEARPEVSYAQVARAYIMEGKKDEALVVAREAVRRFPDSAASYLLLAQLYRDLGDPRKALSVLGLGPAHSMIVHMRAELLRQVGDLPMAERLYQLLLSGSRFGDVVAWQGLMETLTAAKRQKDFSVLCERALASGRLADRPEVAATVHYMRGMTLEMEGKVEEALTDYEAAIKLDGRNWGALNNAAWYIARNTPARVGEARAFVDRAMNLKPNDPSVLDTAAEVYSVQKDLEGALSLMDRVLELAPAAKAGSYTVHKAEILCRGEREEDAKALLEGVRRTYGDEPAGQRARTLLWEIEQKNLPEEEPAPPPVLPEDEGPVGAGGGE